MKKAVYAALILLVTFPNVSCDFNPIFNPDIFNVPETVEIDGYQYSLVDTFLSLNRQPTMQWGADPTPFYAIATVMMSDPSQPTAESQTSVAFPEDIVMTRLWVINGEETWQAKRLKDYGLSNDPDNLLRKKTEGRVYWGDIYVDVVVELVNRSNWKRFLLKISDQYIQISV